MRQRQEDRTLCPICGRGRLVDLTFDGGTGERAHGNESMQTADSSEIDVFSCGHEVPGSSLDRADRSLEVETRESDEPVGDPTPEEPRSRRVEGAA
jgi:hypothetical protein